MARLLVGFAMVAAVLIALPAAAQEAWPARRVTMIVPFGAGSSTDVVARYLADNFRDAFGQPFIVENRGGAGSTLGANAVVKAAPDGYTLLMGGNSTHSAAPAFFKTLPYDPVKDFTAIARVGKWASLVVTNSAQPYRSIKDMVTYAKASPGKVTYGHGNSAGQMVLEAIKKRTQIEIARVPYPSTAPAMTDLLSNNIHLLVADAAVIPQYVQEGKIVPLATFQLKRSALVPNVPTLDETVMPGFEILPWTGLFGPANLPGAIVQQLQTATAKMLERPDAAVRLAPLSAEPFYAGSEEFTRFVVADIPKWHAAAKEAGIEPQ